MAFDISMARLTAKALVSAAADFGRIGVMSELHGELAGELASALAGNPLPPVTDQWLRRLRVK